MQQADWRVGDIISVRGSRWTVSGVDPWPGCALLRLSSLEQHDRTCAILTPFDRPSRLPATGAPRVVRPRHWLHGVRRLSAWLVPYGGATAAGRASIRLLPHQFEPLLAVLRHGAARMLIADAVGMGKTIQAGLIAAELAMRDEAFRALILVPAGLRAQWAQELRGHFGLHVTETDASWLRETARARPADVNPWSLPGVSLCSMDFAKRPEVLRSLEEIAWSLLVLDEAHLATAGSDRRAAAHALACRARHVVLLTATPDAGDPQRFASLCAIGRLGADERPIVLFRRGRADVGPGPGRRSVFLRVRPTRAERRMHALLDRYTRLVWTEAGSRHDPPARLPAIVLRKRALSSAASLAVSARRRCDLLSGASRHAGQQLRLPLDDEDPLPDEIQDEELAPPGLADTVLECRLLEALAEAARVAAVAESKLARLLRWLDVVREPVIVFTEYRDTLERLERCVRATGRPLVTLHGGMERAQRARIQDSFNAGGVSLLATDAAAEGLNLHRRCRVVVHYELPWRPARIEQRAGRVDRLGQERRVHEIALVAAGTAERLVLAPLAWRAARARAAGDRAGLFDSLSESEVAARILGDIPLPQSPPGAAGIPVQWKTTSSAEAEAEVARLTEVRLWTAQSPGPPPLPDRPLVSRIRRARSMPCGTFLIFTIGLVDAAGRTAHREASVLLAPCVAPSTGGSPKGLRAAAERLRPESLEAGTPIHEHLRRAQAAILARVGTTRAEALTALRARDVLRRAAHPPGSRHMVQAGLFDRRAIRAAARQNAARDALAFDIDHEVTALRADPLTPKIELAALLYLAGGVA